ncbi:hypothetical protein K7432_016200 [Basidiobolus ranarum]|uniref:HSF-type DNA-binding domain-containing protein n=1 Tax=Basidiobolus ranarum TaxID=34480 RepID=A0ABR2WF39_9FUNG
MLKGHTGKLSIRIPPFVLNLHKILSEPSYCDMIAWEQSGTRFVIKDPISFASTVLPQYYETNKFTSFSRQLNIYGFHRVSDRRRTKQSQDTSAVIYAHRHFNRDERNSLHLIQRTSSPYNYARIKPSHLQVEKRNSSPSKISTAPSLSPSVNLQPVCEHESELKYAKVISHNCWNCEILAQEKEYLSRTIEYYKSILSEPLALSGVNNTNYRDFWEPDMLTSLYSTILPFSNENTSLTFYPDHCSQFGSNFEME